MARLAEEAMTDWSAVAYELNKARRCRNVEDRLRAMEEAIASLAGLELRSDGYGRGEEWFDPREGGDRKGTVIQNGED